MEQESLNDLCGDYSKFIFEIRNLFTLGALWKIK